jgi:hypothetical protein
MFLPQVTSGFVALLMQGYHRPFLALFSLSGLLKHMLYSHPQADMWLLDSNHRFGPPVPSAEVAAQQRASRAAQIREANTAARQAARAAQSPEEAARIQAANTAARQAAFKNSLLHHD